MGLPVGGDGPDVAPVAVEAVLACAAPVHQARQQLVADVVELVAVLGQRVERVEQLDGREHEHLVGDEVALRLVRLVLVVADRAVAHLHDAVAAGVLGLDLGGDHRHRRARLHVLLDQRAVVLRVHGVRAEHDQRLGTELADQRAVAPQRVGGALLEALALVVTEARLEQQQAAGRAVEVPRPPVREVVAQRDRVELLRHPDVGQPGVVAVREREVDQPVGAGEGHRRLGPALREQLESAPDAAREHDDQRAHARHQAEILASRRSERVTTGSSRSASAGSSGPGALSDNDTVQPPARGSTRCTTSTPGAAHHVHERPGRLSTTTAGTGTTPSSRAAPTAPSRTSCPPNPHAPRRCGAHSGQASGREISDHAALAGPSESADHVLTHRHYP